MTVPLTVTSLTPSSGSYAGGLNVTITGSGFSPNTTDNTLLLGGVPCIVLEASYTQASDFL